MMRERRRFSTMISKDLILTEFPQLSHIVYLNHAGVAPWPTRTATAIKEFADENVYRGPVNYQHWITVESTLRKQTDLAMPVTRVGVSNDPIARSKTSGINRIF